MHLTRLGGLGGFGGVVTAAVVLALAAGGSGYAAGKITGKDVKNNSLTGVDIKNATVAGTDVKNGSLTAGDLAPGVLPSGRQVVVARKVSKRSALENDNATSACLAGEQAIGGSVGISDGSLVGLLYFDPGGEPVVESGRVVGWRARWFNEEQTNNTFVVTALCMKPAG